MAEGLPNMIPDLTKRRMRKRVRQAPVLRLLRESGRKGECIEVGGHVESLSDKFNQSLKSGTPAEKRLARYYLDHPGDISFEMAANVADRLDLSPMTVGRYLRALDIDSYRMPQQTARSAVSLQPAETSYAFPGFQDTGRDYHALREQMDALAQVQTFISEPVWQLALDALSRQGEVFCTSHGSMLPFSQWLAARLHEVREGVRHMNPQDVSCVDLLSGARRDCLLVIIDDHPANAMLKRMANLARNNGCRVMILTHGPEDWSAEDAEYIVTGPAHPHRGGLEPVGLMALIELAAKSVSGTKGPFAAERAARVAELQRALQG